MDALWDPPYRRLSTTSTWRISKNGILKDYSGKAPRIWLRFVDDTFIIISKSESDSFFKYGLKHQIRPGGLC